MATEYFKRTGKSLFCDEYLYQEAMRHTPYKFLVELTSVIDWTFFTRKTLKLYKGQGLLGGPMYKPEIVVKMLFLAYLFNISEREAERYINDSLAMKNFLGLALTESAPDHSTLSVFRDRIIKKRSRVLQDGFDMIISTALEKGVKIGKIQVIDSTHTNADVNLDKDRQRQNPKDEKKGKKPPRDPDANFGSKGTETRTIKDEKGQQMTVKHHKWFFGYKSHLSMNAETNFFTGIKVTRGNKYDGHVFKPLMKHDLTMGIAKPLETIYTADKGYEDGENNAWLNQCKLKDAIFYKGMGKIREAKVRFSLYTSQKEFTEAAKNRYAIERGNACLKKHGGLGRSRYLGLAKMEIQTFFTVMAHNLKTLVRLTCGVHLRAPARS